MFGKNKNTTSGEANDQALPPKKAESGIFGWARKLSNKPDTGQPSEQPVAADTPKRRRKKHDASADLTAEILKVAAEAGAPKAPDQLEDTLLLDGGDTHLLLPASKPATQSYAFGDGPVDPPASNTAEITSGDGFHIGHARVPDSSVTVTSAADGAISEVSAPLLADAATATNGLAQSHEDLLLAAINQHLDSVQAKKITEPVLKIDALPASSSSEAIVIPEAIGQAAIDAPEYEKAPVASADPSAADPSGLAPQDRFLAAVEAHLAQDPVAASGVSAPQAVTDQPPEAVAPHPESLTENPSVISPADTVPIAAASLAIEAALPIAEGKTSASLQVAAESSAAETQPENPPASDLDGSQPVILATEPSSLPAESDQSTAEVIPDLALDQPDLAAQSPLAADVTVTTEALPAGPPVAPLASSASAEPLLMTADAEQTTSTETESTTGLHIGNAPAPFSESPDSAPADAADAFAVQSDPTTTISLEQADLPPAAGPPPSAAGAPVHPDQVLAAIEQHLDASPVTAESALAVDQDLVGEIVNTARASSQENDSAAKGQPASAPEMMEIAAPQSAKDRGKLLTGIEDALLNEEAVATAPVATAAEVAPVAAESESKTPAKGFGSWLKRRFAKKTPEVPANPVPEQQAASAEPAVAEIPPAADSPTQPAAAPSASPDDAPERNLVHLYQSVGLSEKDIPAGAAAPQEGPANTELISAIIETAKKSQEERTKVLGGEFTDQVSIEAAEAEKKKLRHERLILISRFCAGFSLIVPICSWIVFQAVLDSDSKISSLLKAENHGAVHAVLQTKKTEKESQLGLINKEIGVIKEQTASIRENKIIKGIMEKRVDFLGIMLRVNETTLKALNLTPDLNNAIHMLVFNSYTGRLEGGSANITISGTVRDPKRLSISKLTYLIEAINGDDHFNGVELRTFAKSDDELGGTQSAFNFNFKYFPNKTDAEPAALKAAAPAKKKKKK